MTATRLDPPRHRALAPSTVRPAADPRRGDAIAMVIFAAAITALLAFMFWPTNHTQARTQQPPVAPSVTAAAQPSPVGTEAAPDTATPTSSIGTVTTQPLTYTVKAGDNLTQIAAANNEPLERLEADNAAALNGHPDLIAVGLVLTLTQ